MSLRKKTLLIIGLTLAGLLALLYAASYMMWLRGYEMLESQRLRNNTRRALALLSAERETLLQMVIDNAEWDETYEYMRNPHADFIKSNYPNESLALLRINFLALLDTTGALVLSLGYDASTHAALSLPASLQQHFARESLLVRQSLSLQKISGILQIPEGSLLIAASPILTSQTQGPARGVMLLARYWKAAQNEHLTRIMQLPSCLYPLQDERWSGQVLPHMLNSAWSVADSMIAVQVLNTDSSTCRIVLPDIYNRPALALQMTTPPTIYQQGLASIRYFMAALLFSGVVFGVVIILLLEKTVISRFAQLDQELRHIAEISDHSLRATAAGQDEISNLAHAINKMLAALQEVNEKLVRENQERDRAEQKLKTSQEELRNLSAHLEKLREEERAHIAREIHDELGQVLSSLRMDLRTLENRLPRDKHELLELTHSMSEVIYLTLQRVKRISQELRPSVLEHLAFADAAAWQTETFTAKYGIPCDLILENVEDLKLKREVANELFRVLQEALTNIVRHAAATHVEVRLEKNPEHLSLTIQDNGVGMQSMETHASPTFGLLGMRERMHRLKGTLEIVSTAGRGTSIIAAIPLTNLEPA